MSKSKSTATMGKTKEPGNGKDQSVGFEALAILLAIIWGATFVGQKTALEDTGPWLFVAACFVLALPPLVIITWIFERDYLRRHWRHALRHSLLAGVILAITSILVQVGLVYGTAGKAGLIGGFYVCIIPFVACFFGYHLKFNEVAAAFCAFIGLYFLSVTADFAVGYGDILFVLSAFGTAGHILSLDYALRQVKPFSLTLFHTLVCAVIVAALVPIVEPQSITAMARDFESFINNLWFELLYCGVLTAGITVALLVYIQQFLSPNRIGLLTSMECLVAPFAGWVLLGEVLSQRELFGAGLMVASLLVVRLKTSSPHN